MKVTEVKIYPVNEERLRAYVTLTFDNVFVVRIRNMDKTFLIATLLMLISGFKIKIIAIRIREKFLIAAH